MGVWNEFTASEVFETERRDDINGFTRSWVRGIEESLRVGQADGSIWTDVEAANVAAVLANLLGGGATGGRGRRRVGARDQ